MLYMVIEKFRDGRAEEIYRRAATSGRMLPDGLEYLDSWVTLNIDQCYQLMRCSDKKLIAEWIKNWDDVADFEVIPVMPSKDASARTLNNNP